MDLTMQMRSIELLVKFLKHDLKDIPSYGYRLQKPPVSASSAGEPFPRATPESMGVQSAALLRLFHELDARVDTLSIHGAMLLRHGSVIAEGFWTPYRAQIPHMLFSMSKSFIGTAIGMAADEGLLSLDEFVTDIFKDAVTPGILKAQKGLTLRHLLTMSSGSRFNEVGSMLDDKWVKMFLESAPKFEFGAEFDYNSINSYMLSAILKRKSGQSVTEFLRTRLFEPLCVKNYNWERCPQGIEKGGWGLDLCLEDCAKLGQLYLQKGMWHGRRLLSEEWIQAATSRQIETAKGEIKSGYGYHVWVLDNGDYLFNGAFGQYVLVMPAMDAVAAFVSGSPLFFAEGPLYPLLKATFWAASSDAYPEDARHDAALNEYCRSLVFSPSLPEPVSGEGMPGQPFETLLSLLDGREYKLENNTGGLFPQMLQAVHGNYTMGTDMLRFRREGNLLLLDLYEGYQRNTLRLGQSGFTDGVCAMRGEEQLISSRLHWNIENDGDIRLCIVCCFLETPSTRILSIDLCQNAIGVVFLETPAILRSSEMLLDLIGSSGAGYLKRLTALMRRMPGMSEESVNELIRRFTHPSADGAIILSGAANGLRLPPAKDAERLEA